MLNLVLSLLVLAAFALIGGAVILFRRGFRLGGGAHQISPHPKVFLNGHSREN